MPKLTIIAGCNGAGKSTFASSLIPAGVHSFDYDKLFIETYKNLSDSELREQFARDQTTKAFENAISKAIKYEQDFCYETNFDAHPIYWASKFKEQGYEINLVFFCLDNQDIARHRIQVRTEFKGHFVDNETIDLKWKTGYENINLHYSIFDNILFVDNSVQNELYSNILQIEKNNLTLFTDSLPEYFKRRLPAIYKLI